MPTLTIIRGAPGSGKSTLARKLSTDTGAPIWEADMYFTNKNGEYRFDPCSLTAAHNWCRLSVWADLRAGNDVIVANTFTKLWELAEYLAMAEDFEADVEIIRCTGTFNNVHGVPSDKVQKMRDGYEPHPDETIHTGD